MRQVSKALIAAALVATIVGGLESAGAAGTPLRVLSTSDSGRFVSQLEADVAGEVGNRLFDSRTSSAAAAMSAIVAGSADTIWTSIGPTEVQRQGARDNGVGELVVVPVGIHPLAIVNSSGPTAAVSSTDLCAAITAMERPARRFVVRADPSAANVALSDFCIRREPVMWEAYRAAVAANPLLSSGATPEFLAGAPTLTFPYTPGLFPTTSSDAVALTIATVGIGAWGVVELHHAKETAGLRILPLADGGVTRLPDDGTAAKALDAGTDRPDGTHSTQSLPIADGYPLMTIIHMIIPASTDPATRQAVDEVSRVALGSSQRRLRPLSMEPLGPATLQHARTLAGVPGGPTPVVPEFPLAPIGVVTAVGISGAVFVRRRSRSNHGRVVHSQPPFDLTPS